MRLIASPFSGRPFLVWIGFALLAGCSFSEGPDWPAPVTATPEAAVETRYEAGEDQLAAGERQISLAELTTGEAAPPPPGGGATLVGKVRPLVVIRFGPRPPDFEPMLYTTVRSALERRPRSAFDLVAVAPRAGQADPGAVTRDAESVIRALDAMGLPPERMSLSSTTVLGVTTHEVHIYVR